MTKILKKAGAKQSYVCPHCKKTQEIINEWKKAWICYSYDIESQQYEKEDEEDLISDNTQYCCPECGKEIDYDLIKKFYE